MNFFSDERAAEMRELFFESATELLQTLNEDGLELEKHPEDAEILRQVRRIVHTLKGDSAACGFQELSELAHLLEDALTPEVAGNAGASLADVVLMAADTFSSMISAYRGNMQLPAGDEVREQIEALTRKPATGVPYKLQARFAWSEYEELTMEAARERGERIYNVAFSIDPQCPMRAAALQLVRNVLVECGQVLAIVPEQDNALGQDVDVVEALIATTKPREWMERKCRIPSVVRDLLMEEVPKKQGAEEVHDIVQQVTAASEEETSPEVMAEETVPTAAQVPIITPVEQSGTNFSQIENLLRVDAERIDAVLNLVGELIIAKSMLHQTVAEFDKRFPKDPLKMRFADAMAFQARVLNDLQKSVMKIRMVPVEHLFRRFPRVVRDVAKSCGKDVNLVITGQDTDLDKGILDMLAEPLAHLVRNSVDHGIELPDERLQAGKAAQGAVRLAAYHQGNQIVIEVADDGRGIDRDRLVAKAIEKGILTQSDAGDMTEQSALDLIFRPGLSTADHVTSISGRGVGMDVVKTVLERLKGTISIKTEEAKGTTFYLRVPLTLAIIKALLFRVGERMYAVPLASVVEITRATQSEVHRVEGHDVIRLRDEILTLVHLHGLGPQSAGTKNMFVVVVSLSDRKFGLVVDRMVGEEELVIKALDDHLVATELVSGASILGDGTVVLILNISAVVSRAGRMQMTMGATA
ncbi:MAG TPA: chemotaxis protein CheA [Verrucomicrobiae bacterium]|nr:chemotaxis protein CheA [Verrucomicrobiae bacterium]